MLSDSERNKIVTGLMRYWSNLWELIPVLKPSGLKAAIDATDQWIDDNQASFNNALPATARSSLTLAQKTFIFCIVAAFRVSKQFAIKLIGGID